MRKFILSISLVLFSSMAFANSTLSYKTSNAGTVHIYGSYEFKGGVEAFWVSGARHGVTKLPLSTRFAAMFDTGDVICEDLGFRKGVKTVFMKDVDPSQTLEVFSYQAGQDSFVTYQMIASEHPDRAMFGGFVQVSAVECLNDDDEDSYPTWERLR